MPDILAWMMEGYRLWKYEGLHKPKAVEDSVKEYRNENGRHRSISRLRRYR